MSARDEFIQKAIDDSGLDLGEFVELRWDYDEFEQPEFVLTCRKGSFLLSETLPSEMAEEVANLPKYLKELNERRTPPPVDLSGFEYKPQVAAVYEDRRDHWEEYEFTAFIRKHLMTQEQGEYLAINKLTVADVLNGRISIFWGSRVYDYLFPAWNKVLGKEVFSF